MLNNKIVVLGSTNQDLVNKSAHLPKKGETIIGYEFFSARGGKGANQAVAVSRLGGKLSFISCLGKDDFANQLIADYQTAGMDTSKMVQLSDVATGLALIMVDEMGNNCISVAPNANAMLTKEFVTTQLDSLRQADYLLMQLETPIEGVELAAKEAHLANTYVIINPAPAKALSDETYPYVDLITPNETETEILTGIKVTDHASAEAAATLLQQKGVKNVIITLGEKGAYLQSADGIKEIIAGFRVDAKDTTAAGDTFNGALTVALSEGKSLRDAVLFAHRASAISVSRMGAQSSIPSRDEAEQFQQ
jgi:ribokinase